MKDPRDQPIYPVLEAASYLDMPAATLRSWVLGGTYATMAGERQFRPLIPLPPNRIPKRLSFYNLVEAFILNSLRRRDHHESLQNIRKALGYVKKKLGIDRPLLQQAFLTDGVHLFVEKYGQLLNVSEEGQIAMKEVLQESLKQVGRDTHGLPAKLYLFHSPQGANELSILIDPRVTFGYPILEGTGISTAVLAQRYKSGDSIDTLSQDYGLSRNAVEEAIRREVVPLRKAA